MKLVSFVSGREERIGVLIKENEIVDLNSGYAKYLMDVEGKNKCVEAANSIIPPDMIRFLEVGEKALRVAEKTVNYLKDLVKTKKPVRDPVGRRIFYRVEEVKLRAPVPRPPLFVEAAFNTPGILKAALASGLKVGLVEPKEPAYFLVPPTIVIGLGEPIIIPRRSKHVMNSIELCAIIGKRAWKVPLENAEEYIAGYTVSNDVTAIDLQSREPLIYSLYRCKSFPTFKPMGPCLVLKDQIKDPHNLRFAAKVNGVIKQAGNTSENIFTVFEYVSAISQYHPLEVGTPINLGAYMGTDPKTTPIDIVLKPGDVATNEIEGIGVLENPVIAEK